MSAQPHGRWGNENNCDVSKEMKIMADNAAIYNSNDTLPDNGASDNIFEDEDTQTGGTDVRKITEKRALHHLNSIDVQSKRLGI